MAITAATAMAVMAFLPSGSKERTPAEQFRLFQTDVEAQIERMKRAFGSKSIFEIDGASNTIVDLVQKFRDGFYKGTEMA